MRAWNSVSTAATTALRARYTYAAAILTGSDNPDYPKAPNDSYFRLADALDQASIDTVSLEDAHRHNDLSLLEKFRRTTVILGVLAIAKSRVEPVEEIAERLRAALQHMTASG